MDKLWLLIEAPTPWMAPYDNWSVIIHVFKSILIITFAFDAILQEPFFWSEQICPFMCNNGSSEQMKVKKKSFDSVRVCVAFFSSFFFLLLESSLVEWE